MLRIENHCNITQTLTYITVAATVNMQSGPRLEVGLSHTVVNRLTAVSPGVLGRVDSNRDFSTCFFFNDHVFPANK